MDQATVNQSFRIMVVDDDYVSRDILRHWLTLSGFNVSVAAGVEGYLLKPMRLLETITRLLSIEIN